MTVMFNPDAPVTAAVPPARQERLGWLDTAKGVGILLVIVGHALGGIIDSEIGVGAPALRTAFFAIYTFHMPLFFMLAGVLVAERLKRDSRRFLIGIGRTVVWPYFLWSIVQFTLIYALGRLVNAPAANYWPTVVGLPWHTVSQFWFLYALFLLHLAAWALLRPLGPAAFLLIGLAFKPLMALVPMPEVVRLAAQQAPYYAIGVVMATGGVASVANHRPAVVRALILPMVAAGLIAAAWIAEPGFNTRVSVATADAAGIAFAAWQLPVMPTALAGSFATIGLASLASRRLASMLEYLGRRTMPIFVLHVMALAGTRIVLVKLLHISSPGLVLALSVVAGLVVPLVVFTILERFRLTRALGLA